MNDLSYSEIEMRKFETKEDLVEWIETMHLQNTNGRENPNQMFRLGVEAAIEELIELNLLSMTYTESSFPEYDNHDYLRGFVDGYGGEEPHGVMPDGFFNINEVWDRVCELKENIT